MGLREIVTTVCTMLLTCSGSQATVTTNKFQEGQFPDASYDMLDLSIRPSNTTQNDLLSGSPNGVVSRGMLSFDVSTVAAAQQIPHAELRLFLKSGNYQTTTTKVTLKIYRIRHTDEHGAFVAFDSGANWTQATATELWDTVGGDDLFPVGSVTLTNSPITYGYYTVSNSLLAAAALDAAQRGEPLQLQLRTTENAPWYGYTYANEADAEVDRRPLLTLVCDTEAPPPPEPNVARFSAGQYPNALYEVVDNTIREVGGTKSPDLWCGQEADKFNGMISFDLNSLAAAQNLTQASLRLHVTEFFSANGTLQLWRVRHTDAAGQFIPFDETMNWTQLADGVPWNTPGGDAPFLVGAIVITNNTPAGYQTFTGDALRIAALDALQRGEPLQLQLRGASTKALWDRFQIRDSETVIAEQRPLLTLEWSTTPPAPPPENVATFREGQSPDALYDMFDLTITDTGTRSSGLTSGNVSGENNVSRGMLSFDINAIPAQARINSASLMVYVSYANYQSYTKIPIKLYRVRHTDSLGNFVPFDSQATWTQVTNGENWTIPGGDIGDSLASISFLNNPKTYGVYTLEDELFASAVQDARDRNEPLQLQLQTRTDGTWMHLDYGTENDADLEHRPTLIVNYTPLRGTVIVVR